VRSLNVASAVWLKQLTCDEEFLLRTPREFKSCVAHQRVSPETPCLPDLKLSLGLSACELSNFGTMMVSRRRYV